MTPIYLVAGVLVMLLVLDNFSKGSIIKVQRHEINIRETQIVRLENQLKESKKKLKESEKQITVLQCNK